jgi:hypothetical protein
MSVKTSVYLDEGDKRRLSELALATGTSEAELLRRGVRLVLAEAVRPRPRTGTGASHDGRSARDTDALVSESGFGSP